jgi:glycosyltransferase involved in cell wall biosynthesis
VDGLRRLGYDAHVFSIRKPGDAIIPLEARHLAERTTYILPIPPGRLLSRHLVALWRYRWRYARVLLEVVSGTHTRWRDRLRTVCHFAEAVIVLPDVERLRPDHLHAHWAVGSTTCAMVVSRFLGIPFTFTAHAYDIWRERLLLPQKLQAAALAITCTACNREHLIGAHGADPDKVRVVYHGLDLERFPPRPRPVKSEPVILSVGRLVEQKGFDRLLRACGALAAEGASFRCDIVGDGPLREALERLAIDLGLAGRVRFLGRLHQEDLIEHYAGADLFALMCMPASDDDRDGIPNTLIEAMAMELPCVSTGFSGVPELVVDGQTGVLVATDDHERAVAAFRTLLGDAELRRRMGQAGRRRVAEAFTLDTSVAALDAAFSGLRAARASAVA